MRTRLKIDYEAYPGGFSCPLGRLTSRYINMSGTIGVAYERSINYSKDWHEHDYVDITFPQGAARLEFEDENGHKFVVNSSQFMWMPQNIRHRQRSTSVLWDNLALFPKQAAIKDSLRNLRISESSEHRSRLQQTQVLPKSPLLNDLVQRFFEEKIIAKTRNCHGLMKPILEESLRIVLKRDSIKFQLEDLQLPLMDLALRFIEANLFNSITAVDIAKAARTSTATLYRHFNLEVGMKPLQFQRMRRLDEALGLLQAGKHSASDIALIVGYEDLAAFSKSFKLRFGSSPKRFMES